MACVIETVQPSYPDDRARIGLCVELGWVMVWFNQRSVPTREWLDSDETVGTVLQVLAWTHSVTMIFSDSNTAFAARMKFG